MLLLNGFEPELLRQHYIHGTWPRYGIEYEDFEEVQFEKNFEFNYQPDVVDILADKAITGGRSHFMREFIAREYKANWGHKPTYPPGPSPTKRLLLAYLERPEVLIRNIIND